MSGLLIDLLIDLQSDPTKPDAVECYGRKRDPSEVTGVMLHHTACRLGEDPARWKRVNAHIGITFGGKVIIMHDLERVIYHGGNRVSPWTIGIEIDGNHLGFSDGRYWKGNPLDPLYHNLTWGTGSLIRHEWDARKS